MKIKFRKGGFEAFFLTPTIVKAPPPNNKWGLCWLHSAIWLAKD